MAGTVVESHTSGPALASLCDLWTHLLLASGSPNVFLTWEWMKTWFEATGEAGRPYVLVVRDAGGAPRGLAPLFQDNHRYTPLAPRRLRLMGTGFGAEHVSFIARPADDVTREVVEWLVKDGGSWDIVDLRWVAEEQADRICEVVEQYRGLYAYRRTVADGAPFLRLPPSWEEFRAALGPGLRANLGRYGRKLEREFRNVTFRRVRTVEAFEPVWNALARLHQARWQSRGFPGSFVRPRYDVVHRTFARLALERGWLRLYYLEVDGVIIAVFYGFRYGSRVSYFQAGFDTRWARYGPGRLLMAHAIRASIEERATEFDFMRGVEEHKFRWKPELRRDSHLTLYRESPAVLAALRLQDGLAPLRRGARRLGFSRLRRMR